MSVGQKIIKYLAIAFAFYLVFSILLGIMSFVIGLSSIFSNKDEVLEDNNIINVGQNIYYLDIDLTSVNLIIKEGDILKVQTNNKNINVKENNNKLFITEKGLRLFNNKNESNLVIYVPEGFVFSAIDIENGFGKLQFANVSTNQLNLDLGAGQVLMDNLKVTGSAEIDGGAGEIIITDGSYNNLDIDMGVGKFSFNATLLGNTNIDAGVGDLNLDIIGLSSDYKICVDKGIGSIIVDGNNINGERCYGTGFNMIDIDGAVGDIDIIFEQ